ncbi:MAG: DUF4430 domain-containing protein [Clostridia bacterium]|nr:DUF4430 domain-containing protein [Clostridia bacterium]
MKKFFALIASLIAVFACCFAVACNGNNGPDTVVITANDSSFDFDGKTLKDYMDELEERGELTYTVSNGMVTEINGKSQTLNSYWMLYTSDTENASTEWGTFEYEENLYGSATSGVESLVVKEGCIYIWAYQTF